MGVVTAEAVRFGDVIPLMRLFHFGINLMATQTKSRSALFDESGMIGTMCRMAGIAFPLLHRRMGHSGVQCLLKGLVAGETEGGSLVTNPHR